MKPGKFLTTLIQQARLHVTFRTFFSMLRYKKYYRESCGI